MISGSSLDVIKIKLRTKSLYLGQGKVLQDVRPGDGEVRGHLCRSRAPVHGDTAQECHSKQGIATL